MNNTGYNSAPTIRGQRAPPNDSLPYNDIPNKAHINHANNSNNSIDLENKATHKHKSLRSPIKPSSKSSGKLGNSNNNNSSSKLKSSSNSKGGSSSKNERGSRSTSSSSLSKKSKSRKGDSPRKYSITFVIFCQLEFHEKKIRALDNFCFLL